MSYESHAYRKALHEIARLELLVRNNTATKYQKIRLDKLLKEFAHMRNKP